MCKVCFMVAKIFFDLMVKAKKKLIFKQNILQKLLNLKSELK